MKERGCESVYNPFAGFASYAMADFIKAYYGQELDLATYNMAKMRLEINNLDYSHLENTNSFKMWNEYGADCIVSTPPFGLKTDADVKEAFYASSADEYREGERMPRPDCGKAAEGTGFI
jgi:type I restriction-modification system DNA methylase subunit